MKKSGQFRLGAFAAMCLIGGAAAHAEGSAPVNLAEEVRDLRAVTQALQDTQKVQNLMGTLSYMNEAGLYSEIYDRCFAKKTPGVSAQIGARGVFVGPEGVRKTMVDIFGIMESAQAAGMRKAYPDKPITDDMTGQQALQAMGTPVIEVAADGKTAKGMWSALIAQTSFNDDLNKPEAYWVWVKYAVDFVNEDGEWKIWHYNMLPVFRTPYEKSWVASSEEVHAGHPVSKAQLDLRARMPKPDRPPSALFKPYDILSAPVYLPKPPVPYTTFNDADSY